MTTPATRTQQIEPSTLPLYRAAIDHVLTTGDPLTDAALAARTGLSLAQIALARTELIEKDWLGQDADGMLVALYLFSPVPTGITITIDGLTRHAMCALDALGVAPMLDRMVDVASTCIACGAPVAIAVAARRLERWSPDGLVITARSGAGAAFATRCQAMRFACSRDHAQVWLDQHGAPGDRVLTIAAAIETAQQRFATCYSEGRCERPLTGGEVAPG